MSSGYIYMSFWSRRQSSPLNIYIKGKKKGGGGSAVRRKKNELNERKDGEELGGQEEGLVRVKG